MESLVDEVCLSLNDPINDGFSRKDFNTWESVARSKTGIAQKLPSIGASADMGWSTRGCGSSYSSHSGQMSLVGVKARCPALNAIFSDLCGVCSKHQNSNDVPEHDCISNHAGSAGSMEPKALLKLAIQMEEHFFVNVKTTH